MTTTNSNKLLVEALFNMTTKRFGVLKLERAFSALETTDLMWRRSINSQDAIMVVEDAGSVSMVVLGVM